LPLVTWHRLRAWLSGFPGDVTAALASNFPDGVWKISQLWEKAHQADMMDGGTNGLVQSTHAGMRRTNMSALPTVPVTITPEAVARLAELGMQAELEQMLEHVRQAVPQLRSIDVEPREPHDTGEEPGISIRVWTRLPWQQVNAVSRPLARWRRETFPPHVSEHLWISVLCGGNHAGQSIPGPGSGSDQGQR
jgi:hypothetical protein